MIRAACIFALALAGTAAAAQVDANKRAAFVAALEAHDCRMHNFAPKASLIDAIFSAGIERADVRPIAEDLMAKGEAERQGEYLILKTGACS